MLPNETPKGTPYPYCWPQTCVFFFFSFSITPNTHLLFVFLFYASLTYIYRGENGLRRVLMSFHCLWCYKEFIVSLGWYHSLPEFFFFFLVLIEPTQVPSMNRNVTMWPICKFITSLLHNCIKIEVSNSAYCIFLSYDLYYLIIILYFYINSHINIAH